MEDAEDLRNKFGEKNQALILEELALLDPFPKIEFAVPRKDNFLMSNNLKYRKGIYVTIDPEDKQACYLLQKDGLHRHFGMCTYTGPREMYKSRDFPSTDDSHDELILNPKRYAQFHDHLWNALKQAKRNNSIVF